MKKACLLIMVLIFALTVPVRAFEVVIDPTTPSVYTFVPHSGESQSFHEGYGAQNPISFPQSHDGAAVINTSPGAGFQGFFLKDVTVTDSQDLLKEFTMTFHVTNNTPFTWSDYHFIFLGETNFTFINDSNANSSTFKGLESVSGRSAGTIKELRFYSVTGEQPQLVDPGDIVNFEVPFTVGQLGTFQLEQVATIEASSVPEPGTMLLLGSGLIGLAGYRRKKFLKK